MEKMLVPEILLQINSSYSLGLIEQIVFLVEGIIIIISSFCVILSRNTVHSVLFLILLFVNSACLILLVGLDFIALIYIIVYVGAIAVLFLFVVMMLNVKIVEISEGIQKYIPVSGLIALVFLFEGAIFISKENMNRIFVSDYFNEFVYLNWISKLDYMTNIKVLGSIMYTYYVLPFFLAGLILLIAMIGSIVLTLSYKLNTKRQVLYSQINKDFEKSLRFFP